MFKQNSIQDTNQDQKAFLELLSYFTSIRKSLEKTITQQNNALLNLPPEIFTLIAKDLGISDIKDFVRTCKQISLFFLKNHSGGFYTRIDEWLIPHMEKSLENYEKERNTFGNNTTIGFFNPRKSHWTFKCEMVVMVFISLFAIYMAVSPYNYSSVTVSFLNMLFTLVFACLVGKGSSNLHNAEAIIDDETLKTLNNIFGKESIWQEILRKNLNDKNLDCKQLTLKQLKQELVNIHNIAKNALTQFKEYHSSLWLESLQGNKELSISFGKLGYPHDEIIQNFISDWNTSHDEKEQFQYRAFTR